MMIAANTTQKFKAVLLAIVYVIAYIFLAKQFNDYSESLVHEALFSVFLVTIYTFGHLKWIQKWHYFPLLIVAFFTFLGVFIVLLLVSLPHAASVQDATVSIFQHMQAFHLLLQTLPSLACVLMIAFRRKLLGNSKVA